MSHFRPVALQHASRLLNHGPSILVTNQAFRNPTPPFYGHRLVDAPVEFTPPRVAIVVGKATWSRELIESSGVFGVCMSAAV